MHMELSSTHIVLGSTSWLKNRPIYTHHCGSIDFVFVSTAESVNKSIVISSLCNLAVLRLVSSTNLLQDNPLNTSAGHTVWNYKMADWDIPRSLINDFD